MTHTNEFKKTRHTVFLLWCIVVWNFMRKSSACPLGQYKSDYLGDCGHCPKNLHDCQDQEFNDSLRCFNACRKIYSTPQPTQKLAKTTDVPKSSVSLYGTTVTTEATEIPTQVHEVSSKRHDAYQKFKTTLPITSTPHSTSGPSDGSNTTDIMIGITMTITALLLVVVVLFAVRWMGRSTNSTKEQQPDPVYVAVPTSSISNSDENLKPEARCVTEEQADDKQEECSLPALSCEHLNEMPETHL